MKNVEMKVDKGKLVITVDLSKTFGLSKSQKTTIVGSTEGFANIDNGGKKFSVGLNVITK